MRNKPQAKIHEFPNGIVLEFDSENTAREIGEAIFKAPPGARFIALGVTGVDIADLHANIRAAKAKWSLSCVGCATAPPAEGRLLCRSCQDEIDAGPSGN